MVDDMYLRLQFHIVTDGHRTELAKQYRGVQAMLTRETRSSADADNALDAFVGQSRSTNISGPFQVK